MVSGNYRRALVGLGIVSGGAYLVVLPFGHVVALRSVSLVIALFAAVMLWIAFPPRGMRLLGVFGVWAGSAGLSLLNTPDLHSSLHAIEGEIVRSFIVFFVFYTVSRRTDVYRTWVLATALGALSMSLIAMASFYSFGEWRDYYVASLGDYSTSAITLVPLLGGYLAFARNDRKLKVLGACAMAALLITGYMTHNRAFWFSLVCALLTLILVNAVWSGSLTRRSVVAILCAVAIGITAAAVVGGERGIALSLGNDRPVLYAAVIKKIASNPLTGSGYGHMTDRLWYEARFPGTGIQHAHNIALSYLDQMGPLGFVVVCLIFGVPAIAFARAASPLSERAGMAAASGLALLLSVFTKDSFDFFFINQSQWLFFAHLGIYLGELDRIGEASPSIG